MKIATTSEMKAMDLYASRGYHIPEEILMENAGQAASSVLSSALGGIAGRRFAVICGVGNNGGDGLVVARHLLAAEGVVSVFILGDPARFQGAAKSNFEIISRLPIPVSPVNAPEELSLALAHTDAIIDGIFGTGLDRDVAGLFGEAIRLINDSGKKVLSLDIPSGINGDTGEVMGAAVRADWTIAFGLPKRGNILYPGLEFCGRLYLAPISFPPALSGNQEIPVQLNDDIVLPTRNRSAHKGSLGEALFIAGARNYYGAPLFCALAFLKSGGGYARLALPESLASAVAAAGGSEIVFVPQKETGDGSIAGSNREELLTLAGKMDLVVIGPGLSRAPETATLVRELAVEIEKPLIIDGDGLHALASDPGILRKRKIPAVLTPHLGEMSRLSGRSREELEREKIPFVQRYAAEWGAIIVLKGPHSLIACPDGQVFINMSGNPGMATAGSGDVLPGAIAAMFGLGLPLEEAVRKGVYLHGLAGDIAALKRGEDGMTARDILECLPAALRQDREGLSPVFRERYEVFLV
ncbi:MAG: NAD(P)H-hydrate dehydratase [Smithellaceae bacterium]|nr:NAD(P)H-hydrate dehydratase [Smithellaceae bacterium]